MSFIGIRFVDRYSNAPSLGCRIDALASKELWCEDSDDWKNICDGTIWTCITQAKSLCLGDASCHGFMWHEVWGADHNGVKNCNSSNLTTKPLEDWKIYLKKCDTGIDSIATFNLEIGSFYHF